MRNALRICLRYYLLIHSESSKGNKQSKTFQNIAICGKIQTMKHTRRVKKLETAYSGMINRPTVWRVWYNIDTGETTEDIGDGVRRPVTWELMPVLSAEGRMPLVIYEGGKYGVAV